MQGSPLPSSSMGPNNSSKISLGSESALTRSLRAGSKGSSNNARATASIQPGMTERLYPPSRIATTGTSWPMVLSKLRVMA